MMQSESQRLSDAEEESRATDAFLSKLREKFGERVNSWRLPPAEKNPPDIAKAREHWDKFVVPRHEIVKGENGEDVMQMCEPGEDGQVYDVWGTPVHELSEFGLGIGAYFYSLIFMSATMLVLGVISIGSMRYFLSDEYGANQEDMSALIRGSAACPREVICLNAACDQTVEARVCPFNSIIAWTDLVGFLVLLISFGLFSRQQEIAAEKADLDVQTAQDYSIIVNDPSPDATDPEEWGRFFADRFGPVRLVTVTLNNGDLMQKLGDRRLAKRSLAFLHTPGASADEINLEGATGLTGLLQRIGLMGDVAYYAQRVSDLTQEIDALLGDPRTREATKVFVTFDNEEDQRRCLMEMTDGLINTATDMDMCSWLTGHSVGKKYHWGDNVLHVEEAPEPSDVIWKYQHVPMYSRFFDQLLGLFACFVFVAIAAYIIIVLNDAKLDVLVAIFISLANSCLPELMRAVTNRERHLTWSSVQNSMLTKLVISRWMTTAIIFKIITEVSETTDELTIGQISKILVADAVQTPLLRLFDVPNRLTRILVAPGAKNSALGSFLPCLATVLPGAETQAKMDSYFEGSKWDLAERYTDMTKSIFVAMFNYSVYPAGVFISFVCLVMNYWVDKYCLLRIWEPKPKLGTSATKTNRAYIALTLVFHIVSALHTFAAWPFDGYYATDEEVTAANSPSARAHVYVKSSTSMDPMDHSGIFLVSSDEAHMTETQKEGVLAFNILALVWFVLFLIIYFGEEARVSVRKIVRGVYTPVGEHTGPPHSSFKGNDAIDAYTPLIKVPGIKYPLIACELDYDVAHLPFTITAEELTEFNIWREICDPDFGGNHSFDPNFSNVAMFEATAAPGGTEV